MSAETEVEAGSAERPGRDWAVKVQLGGNRQPQGHLLQPLIGPRAYGRSHV